MHILVAETALGRTLPSIASGAHSAPCLLCMAAGARNGAMGSFEWEAALLMIRNVEQRRDKTLFGMAPLTLDSSGPCTELTLVHIPVTIRAELKLGDLLPADRRGRLFLMTC